MKPTSRIAAARSRALSLKRAVAAVAAVGFVAATVLARTTNPGQTQTHARSGTSGSASSSSSSSTVTPDQSDDQNDQSGGFAIAPSTEQPQAQSSVS
jgi:hypothetical protein